jgi:hypothetical protein
MRHGSQFSGMLFHPPINGGISLDSTVESQQFRHLHGNKSITQKAWVWSNRVTRSIGKLLRCVS